jgi:hypothetical protein
MTREEMVAARGKALVAGGMLRRLLEDQQIPKAEWDKKVRASVRGNNYSRFFPLFAPLNAVSHTAQNAVAGYATSLQSEIRSARSTLSSRRAYNPVQEHMKKAAGIAAAILKDAGNRRSRVGDVSCNAGVSGVRVAGLNDNINIGPMWLKRIRDEGIATATFGAKTAFVISATPKSSAFLAADGITAWDAKVYFPDGTRQVMDGFVFRSAGDKGFPTFSTDFMRGAGQIRKKVTEAVLKELAAS